MEKLTLFAQIISLLPKEKAKKIIREHGTDKYCKGYDTWSQFVSMVFSRFSGCDSVRDVSNGPNSATGNLNHFVNITDGKVSDNKAAFDIESSHSA